MPLGNHSFLYLLGTSLALLLAASASGSEAKGLEVDSQDAAAWCVNGYSVKEVPLGAVGHYSQNLTFMIDTRLIVVNQGNMSMTGTSSNIRTHVSAQLVITLTAEVPELGHLEVRVPYDMSSGGVSVPVYRDALATVSVRVEIDLALELTSSSGTVGPAVIHPAFGSSLALFSGLAASPDSNTEIVSRFRYFVKAGVDSTFLDRTYRLLDPIRISPDLFSSEFTRSLVYDDQPVSPVSYAVPAFLLLVPIGIFGAVGSVVAWRNEVAWPIYFAVGSILLIFFSAWGYDTSPSAISAEEFQSRIDAGLVKSWDLVEFSGKVESHDVRTSWPIGPETRYVVTVENLRIGILTQNWEGNFMKVGERVRFSGYYVCRGSTMASLVVGEPSETDLSLSAASWVHGPSKSDYLPFVIVGSLLSIPVVLFLVHRGRIGKRIAGMKIHDVVCAKCGLGMTRKEFTHHECPGPRQSQRIDRVMKELDQKSKERAVVGGNEIR